MAVYKLKLPPGEIWDSALSLSEAKHLNGKRGEMIQISVPDAPKAKVQVFRESVIIFCFDLGELRSVRDWLNKRLGTCDNQTPLESPVKIWLVGSRQAFSEFKGSVDTFLLDPAVIAYKTHMEGLNRVNRGFEILTKRVNRVNRGFEIFASRSFEEMTQRSKIFARRRDW